jgi:hypothetical protein
MSTELRVASAMEISRKYRRDGLYIIQTIPICGTERFRYFKKREKMN